MKKEFVGKERNQFGFDYYEVSSLQNGIMEFYLPQSRTWRKIVK